MARYVRQAGRRTCSPMTGGRKSGRRRAHGRPVLLPLVLGLLLLGGGFRLGAFRAAELPMEELEAASPAAERGTPLVPLDPAEQAPSEDTAWELLVVSGANPLPEGFTVPELTELKGGHAVDSRMYPALQQMMDDCRAAGLEPWICSSYRTREKQEELFQNKVERLLDLGYSEEAAQEEAVRWVARPGTSEHETGLAVDIVDKSYQILDRKQEQTPVQQWLMDHCAAYGFILRYPTDKSALTGIGYEPWHYRYVGREAAAAIMEQGICLEEYEAA